MKTVVMIICLMLTVVLFKTGHADDDNLTDVATTGDTTGMSAGALTDTEIGEVLIWRDEKKDEDESFKAPPDTYIDDSIYVKNGTLWARKTYSIGDNITVMECGDDCVEIRTLKDKYRIYADGKAHRQARYPTLSEDSPTFRTCVSYSRELAWAHNVPFCEDL